MRGTQGDGLTMEIRQFDRKDATAVLDLWNTTLEQEKSGDRWYVDENRLSEVGLERMVSNPNFDADGAFVACEGTRILGYGRGVVKRVKSFAEDDLESLPGFLEGLVVSPLCRRKGIGTSLYQQIESYVRERGKRELHIVRARSAVSGLNVLPDTPEHAFLLAKGFRGEWRSIRLELDFRNFALRKEVVELRRSLEQDGIDILYYEDRFRESLGALMETHFRNWWFGSYRPNLEREVPLPVLIAVDTDRNRVVGFTGFVRVGSSGRAGFSPGVDPAYRGRGIGKVLANLWAADVKQQGAVESVIGTGVGNVPAKSVYFGMGYRQTAEFFTKLVKPLDTPHS